MMKALYIDGNTNFDIFLGPIVTPWALQWKSYLDKKKLHFA